MRPSFRESEVTATQENWCVDCGVIVTCRTLSITMHGDDRKTR